MMKRWIILLLALMLLPCAALCEGEVVLQDEMGNVVSGEVWRVAPCSLAMRATMCWSCSSG